MIGSECNLGLAYLCLTEQNEDEVVLSEELNDAKWIDYMDFEKYIHNKRMLEDLERRNFINKRSASVILFGGCSLCI